jgi:16S rRNA (cytosine1402-N4)-methyltransferase
LLALDKDIAAVEQARYRFAHDPRFTILHRGFEDLHAAVAEVFGQRRIDGLLLDLGTSSPQLDDPARGFSFSADGPLDMRMNQTAGPTAADWLLATDEAALARTLRDLGEERYSRRIARAIHARITNGPITGTAELAALVESVVPTRERRIHPATRVFQALRIAVNRELDALGHGLRQSLDVLTVGGRLVVISFHSLEDRIVKRFIAAESRGDPVYAGLPQMPVAARPRLAAVGRLIRPGDAEILANPRARSGRLRIAERLGWDLGGQAA